MAAGYARRRGARRARRGRRPAHGAAVLAVGVRRVAARPRRAEEPHLAAHRPLLHRGRARDARRPRRRPAHPLRRRPRRAARAAARGRGAQGRREPLGHAAGRRRAGLPPPARDRAGARLGDPARGARLARPRAARELRSPRPTTPPACASSSTRSPASPTAASSPGTPASAAAEASRVSHEGRPRCIERNNPTPSSSVLGRVASVDRGAVRRRAARRCRCRRCRRAGSPARGRSTPWASKSRSGVLPRRVADVDAALLDPAYDVGRVLSLHGEGHDAGAHSRRGRVRRPRGSTPARRGSGPRATRCAAR